MIFGRTSTDKISADRTLKMAKIYGLSRFLWLPEPLDDGRWAWLCTVISYYHGYKSTAGEYTLIHGSTDSYCPIYKNVLVRDDKHINLRKEDEIVN